MIIPDLKWAFMDGDVIETQYGLYTLKIFSPGRLTLTTGKILACDPLAFWEKVPFERTAKPGNYPILLTIAHRQENNDERVAYARIQFMPDAKPSRWELATLPGQDISTLKEDEFFGYGVDAGTGCFMDVAAVEQWQEMIDQDFKFHTESPIYRESPIDVELRKHYVHTWNWGDFKLDTTPEVNVIVFSSGFGDGAYPSYWGIDENDQIICLLTDFMILDEPDTSKSDV